MKLYVLIELTNTNKCGSLKSIIKYYSVGYSLFLNIDFNVTRQKSKNTGSAKEDVSYTFTSYNSLNIFKCGLFDHSGCVFMGYNLVHKKECIFCSLY